MSTRLFTLLLIAFSSFCAQALNIEITRGNIAPDPIAIVDFYDKSGNDSSDGSEVAEIVRNDLETSGLFISVDPASFLESKQTLCQNGANIKNWNIINARFLVHGKITSNITVEFELIDVITGNRMLSLKVSGSKAKIRRIAHAISDFIYERITNEKGYFNTQVIYVETSDNRIPSKRKTRLVRIDQDGFNRKPLTDGKELVTTPRYAADGKTIAYISYSDKAKDVLGKSAHVYIMNPETGSSKLMIGKDLMKLLIRKNHGAPVQMTYAPRFSPDGENAVLAIIIDGKSAIYTINFATNKLTQLTEHSCIDTSPGFSNDGNKIVFTSNRQGREAIYTMDSDGANVTRISRGEGKYSQPTYSPRGDLIAFSKQIGGQFFIGVMKEDGSGERLITSGYLVESPCWASNGRYIIYSTETGPGAKAKIAVVDITGRHTRMINTDGDASYPAWSPIDKTK
ncbi:MAG: Tol-Pal system protein TolB [Holosporales bacterium]|jgi:TolB protein|nr:Tol-Pal system protein TolB [Holosporales bacterium]